MMQKRVVLVAGAQGVTGYAAANHFASHADTQVYGLSRRQMSAGEAFFPIHVDLLTPTDVTRALANLTEVTHVIFAAYLEQNTPSERSRVNVELLRNLLDVVERSAPRLQHVVLYQGGKAYGADLGPFKTPAREDDPRLMSPNFYYDQEDFLKERQAGKKWHYTVLRPEAVCGYGIGNPMNLTMIIGVYAAISKELGLPLRFPGTRAAYEALYQVTSADILARASAWAGQSESAREQVFNITNGDYFRWKFMWPKIAEAFGMQIAEPVPMPLNLYMADKAPLWEKITKRYDLEFIPYAKLVDWRFGDFIFNTAYDNITSTIKARRHGFNDCIDSEDMFKNFFAEMRVKRILPPLRSN